ncbi:hypothetical protein [uncultured Algoriphagus sp.]|uniref:hypothetical protein n=1 Tax=uncultured Algoriphagus sp. TaxID=417365 RepID=UPI0030ED43F2|tara:strand:- start:7090 stop:7548 length:459 start_codon:yes stop_codon:yes gene_type:complete
MTTSELLKIIIGSSLLTTGLFAGVSLMAKTWIVERIKLALQKEHTQFNTDLQWEVKVRERAERVAEYISLAKSLKESSSEDDYRKANRLSWELAMWLPAEIYGQMVGAIVNPNQDNNALTVIIAVRKMLLKTKAGNLNEDQIAHHAPGIGRK